MEDKKIDTRFVVVPKKLLMEKIELFITYMYISSNRYRNSDVATVNYKTLAEQMGIDIRYVKQNVNKLVEKAYLEVSEPYVKKNGKKGAVTFSLYAVAKYFVILPMDFVLNQDIPRNYKYYYVNLKYCTNLETLIAYHSPNQLMEKLRPSGKALSKSTFSEFMSFIKAFKIHNIPLLVDASNDSEYIWEMPYEQYIYTTNKNNKLVTTEKERAKEAIEEIGRGKNNEKVDVVI